MSAPCIGVIGGGQLARMMQPAAINLGIHLRLLASAPSDCAAQVIPDTHIGDADDWNAVESFANGCDVVTFDHEHVPSEILQRLVDSGIKVRPGPHALTFAQDKLAMRHALTNMGIPCPEWCEITSISEISGCAQRMGWPLIIKTASGGYDGKGVWVVHDVAQATDIVTKILASGNRVLAEVHVPFTRELSAQIVRNPSGEYVVYPVVQSTQLDGICHEVIAPCPDLSNERSAQAQEIAIKIAVELDVTGMLAVELFDTGAQILVNELAMRPHNSGHWSMDGAITSQFENHLRAVLDWPLGSATPTGPSTVMVNLLSNQERNLHERISHILKRDPEIKVHLYGKESRLGRKIGHVNVSGDNIEELRERAHSAAKYLTGEIDE